jgi:DhnA family fructose-bisphosphate aldolase class Ia
MTPGALLRPDGRAVVVAVDHGLYSWPVRGLERRFETVRAVSSAGADGVIASYGTIRDGGDAFGSAARIVKLDLSTVTLGGYAATEFALAWTVDDAIRVGADAVLTLVQLGTPFELETLRGAARVAAAADRAGILYVCEILPCESPRFPDPSSAAAVAAAARTAAELGAHVVKTSMPTPPEAVAEAVGCGVPILLAGGDLRPEREALFEETERLVAAGAAGVAYGRNVWGSGDPAATVSRLVEIVHP